MNAKAAAKRLEVKQRNTVDGASKNIHTEDGMEGVLYTIAEEDEEKKPTTWKEGSSVEGQASTSGGQAREKPALDSTKVLSSISSISIFPFPSPYDVFPPDIWKSIPKTTLVLSSRQSTRKWEYQGAFMRSRSR